MTRPPYKRHEDTVHEEEESDLQAFLRNGREFFERYGTAVLVFILAVLVAYVATTWYTGREQRLRESAYGELAQASSPLGKQDVASRYEHVPAVASKGYLEAADLLLMEAMSMGNFMQEQPEQLDDEQRQERLDRAIELYERVIQINHSGLYVNNARWGLAAVYENLGEFDAAAEQYAHIAENEDAYGHHRLAANYQRELDRLAEPVTFPERQPQTDQPLFSDPDGQSEGVQNLLDSFQFQDGAPGGDLPDQPIIPDSEPETDEAGEDADADPAFESDLNINVDQDGGDADQP